MTTLTQFRSFDECLNSSLDMKTLLPIATRLNPSLSRYDITDLLRSRNLPQHDKSVIESYTMLCDIYRQIKTGNVVDISFLSDELIENARIHINPAHYPLIMDKIKQIKDTVAQHQKKKREMDIMIDLKVGEKTVEEKVSKSASLAVWESYQYDDQVSDLSDTE